MKMELLLAREYAEDFKGETMRGESICHDIL